jgi:3-oxoacyl-[acyl-carrier-protein] synthase I
MMPIAVLGAGMMTGVGLSAPATCAAMRAALSSFAETRFKNADGEWVIGSSVPLDPPWRGRAKLAHLAATAIRECLSFARHVKPGNIPLLLCVAEKERPGRLGGLDDQLLPEVQSLLGLQFHPLSCVIARGRVAGAVAVDRARKLIQSDRLERCLVAGVDSFLVGPMLAAYESKHRLLTSANSNGFIPGEAGAAVLLGPAGASGEGELRCVAIGFGHERATVESEEPLRGDGLVEAYRAMRLDGGASLDDADYRYTDCNGEQYGFKDDQLAYQRTVRKLKARFDHLHPADSIGEIGAAVGPCVLGLALAAARKGYAPGNGIVDGPGKGVLCHFSNDEGDRAAMLLRYVEKGESP